MLRHRLALSWFLIMSISCSLVVVAGLSAGTPTASANHQASKTKSANITVPVYVTAKGKILQVPLEQYVLGVVAAEMPDQFASEALKAQAIAARTYIVHKMLEARATRSHKSFIIKDSTVDQVYIEASAMERKWVAANDREGLARLKAAVQATRGTIITYDNQPIDATYFSTSNGYTENSQDYWGDQVPYLQSVASPWDRLLSNRYKTTVRMTYRELFRKLGIHSESPRALARAMKVIERTDGKRIKTIRIGKQTLSGRHFREKLGLRSTHFTWTLGKEQIAITTYGNGHGVGLSQWGAQGMALKGVKAQQILKHYYRGVQLSTVNSVWPKSK